MINDIFCCEKLAGSCIRSGVIFIQYDLQYPSSGISESRFDRFYREGAEAFASYIKSTVSDMIEEKYQMDDNPRKRFFFHAVNVKMRHNITFYRDNMLCIRETIGIDGGELDGRYAQFAEVWDTENEVILCGRKNAGLLSNKIQKNSICLIDGKQFHLRSHIDMSNSNMVERKSFLGNVKNNAYCESFGKNILKLTFPLEFQGKML